MMFPNTKFTFPTTLLNFFQISRKYTYILLVLSFHCKSYLKYMSYSIYSDLLQVHPILTYLTIKEENKIKK